MTTHHDVDPRTAPHSVAVAARAAAIVQALDEHFLIGSVTKRAAELAMALQTYRSTVYWPNHRLAPPKGSSPRSVALHEILRLGRGGAPTVGQIRAIAGRRAAA